MTSFDRIHEILTQLERTRENLLALSDDIWLSIPHNEPEALEAGVAFKRQYNEKLAAFDKLASELSALVQQYTDVPLEPAEAPDAATVTAEGTQRVIQALDRSQPHFLNENFTYKRPHGFVLRGHAYEKLVTWKRLYQLVCQVLLSIDPAPIRERAEGGNPYFSTHEGDLRSPVRLADGLYAEANLSASSICEKIRSLLFAYKIPENELKIYLREDRDAEA